MKKHCDNFGKDKNLITNEQLRLKEVRLSNNKTTVYCDNCRGNKRRKEIKNQQKVVY